MSTAIWQSGPLRLRPVQAADLPLFELMGDDIARFCDELQFPQTTERRQAWLERECKTQFGDTFRWVADTDASLEAVGTINTFACSRRHGTFKYGLALARPYWGQGYARHLILPVLRFFFLELGYQKATPHVYAFNERSLLLHRKLGFQEEGRLRSMIYTGGEYHDEIHFGMTRAEFITRYGTASIE
ncbi:GNAT family N-acetyltransferase [Paenibacillus sp. y28]|uniref:GNAT family N-acetyltransferase n=1 Tax=Paenibacillus sp. y28 TaxID=3129110 RepID=UPI0030188ECA